MMLLAIGVGLLIGLSLGALGGGGSILTIPALVYLLGQSPHQAKAASLLVVGLAAAATVVGLVTGLFGVGGGFVVVPALVLALGFDMPVAVGTSLVVIALN